ncbi:MAG TPA: hypothetical protein VKQ29_11920 [Aliidongia sp.]|nr:hypothetical protein [Aliidongia sp.]
MLALHPGPGLAQSEETAPTNGDAPKAEDTDLYHRHGGGGDDEGPRGLLRGNATLDPGTRLESTAGVGLAMDHSPLPGELGDTPEGSRPLFSKSSTSLEMQADPWMRQQK